MTLLLIVLASAACLAMAYRLYGGLLGRLLRLDDRRTTPAQALRDDVDYVPTSPQFLMGQHFSAIAAAGPIVGPILAGLWFGWAPALIWIILGSIFIGGVHDFASLVASIRHKALSIAEVLRQYTTRRTYLLFLAFIWIALVYIIVAFTDLVAGSFVGRQDLSTDATAAVSAAAAPAGQRLVVEGGATASSSLLYLALPILMGLLLRYTRLTVGWATVIFLPLVGVAIWAGPYMPLDLARLLGWSDAAAVKLWDVLLLGYCLLAGAAPVWLLLQPRGHLGGYFLFIAVLGGIAGMVLQGVGGWLGWCAPLPPLQYPAFKSWDSAQGPLVPILFITVACGACSGFHCLIASGTTSKQLRRESDALPIGYGAMLAEGLVAVLSLACVMILVAGSPQAKAAPNLVYASGLAQFLKVFGLPVAFAMSFGLLAFTTFVYDTLDVCTRLGRFIVQELTGWHGTAGRWFGTAVTAIVPVFFVTMQGTDPASGKAVPAWKVFWSLFGASNQLLAALALLCVTVWLWRTRRAWWVWLVVGAPMAFMYVMSLAALLLFIRHGFFTPEWRWHWNGSPVPWAAAVLVLLAVLVLIEAIRVFRRPPGSEDAAPAGLAVEPAG